MITLNELGEQHRRLGLPPALTRLALEGGAAVHPALGFRVESVWPSVWESIAALPGADDLVPLWGHGTTMAFAGADGTFQIWSAEAGERWDLYTDLPGLVRNLLTDLWEDEVSEVDRSEVAALLLPPADVAGALVPEDR